MDPERAALLAHERAEAARRRATRAKERIAELQAGVPADEATAGSAFDQARDALERVCEVEKDAADVHEEAAIVLRDHGWPKAASRAEQRADKSRERAAEDAAEARSLSE